MYAKWTRLPGGNYIGVIEINNRHYYAHGRTADHLEKNLKHTVYQRERIPASQIWLEQQKSDSIDLRWATKIFLGKFCKASDMNPREHTREIKKTTPKTPTPKSDSLHISEFDKKTGELVIYEMREVARYKMKPRKTFEVEELKPTIDQVSIEPQPIFSNSIED